MNVILLYIDHRRVSITLMAVLRVAIARILTNIFLVCRDHSTFKIIWFCLKLGQMVKQ